VSRKPAADDDAFDIDAFRRGDPECFRQVLKGFGPIIRDIVASYARTGDDQDELYQLVSIRLLTQRGRYEEWGAMRGWVARLAHNCCRNWFEARKARQSALDRYAVQVIPIEDSGALMEDPARLLDYRRFLERLENALNGIPPRQAQAFRLVHIEGRTPADAARKMKVGAATVRSHIRSARENLRELLEEERHVLS